jgi:hypothetical protein
MSHRLLATGIAIALASVTLTANIVVPAEFRDVVTSATVIVRGRVTDVRSVIAPDRTISSFATIAVESVLKGDAPNLAIVKLPGGEAGGVRVVRVGAPTFKVGDRAVFLLKPGADKFLRPVGLSMGVYRVRIDPATGAETIAAPIVAGRTATAGQRLVRGDVRRQAMSVSEFESLVQMVSLGRAVRRGIRR